MSRKKTCFCHLALDTRRHGGCIGMTWGEYWPQFIDRFCKTRLRPKTLDLKNYVGKSLLIFFEATSLCMTNDFAIDDFTADLTKRQLGNRTVNIHLTTLAQALRVAVRWQYIERLPYTKIRLLNEGPLRVRALDAESRRDLLNAARMHQNGALYDVVLFFLLTGLRRSELAYLRWSEVSIEGRSVTIQDSKSGQSRIVPLPETAISMLRNRNKVRRLGIPWVFFNPDTARPWADLTHTIKHILRNAGLDHWRLHDLRHAYASHLNSLGASTSDLMEFLGHSTPRMTKRYTHVTKERVDTLMARADKSLEGWNQLELENSV